MQQMTKERLAEKPAEPIPVPEEKPDETGQTLVPEPKTEVEAELVEV